MSIVVFGLNHNTAPVEIREKLYISEPTIPELLHALKGHGIHEAVVLSTCNRTEIYFSSEEQEKTFPIIREILEQSFEIKPEWLQEHTYTFHDEYAYRHLFLVASGLDAIELSKKIFGELHQKRILVIGAGEMCEIALKHFKKEGLSEIFITNRTFRHAQKLAEDITGIPCPFIDIPDLLTKVDMVLSSTGSEKPIIDKELVRSMMKKRKNRPLFFMDIAVPRDIDPEVNKIGNVYLYDIDDLKELSQQHLSDRLKESERAYAIVEEEAVKFTRRLEQLDTNPLITHIFEMVEEIRNSELKKTVQKLKKIDDNTLKSMEVHTKTIVKKNIHPHDSLIKKNGSPEVLDMMKKLFNFEGEDEKDMDNRDEG
ncbi:MAG: glutamyl-tRNA reductase [Proteobacteria bacterium]|nr:glutamyl-tRNA reductase [Pseudomonadota bacterium]